MRERPDERYIGQRRVEAGGGNSRRELYHYGARAYLPGVGIFTQPDSIVPNPRNPQALNRFSYAYNNPVRYNDSGGHAPVDQTTPTPHLAAVRAPTPEPSLTVTPTPGPSTPIRTPVPVPAPTPSPAYPPTESSIGPFVWDGISAAIDYGTNNIAAELKRYTAADAPSSAFAVQSGALTTTGDILIEGGQRRGGVLGWIIAGSGKAVRSVGTYMGMGVGPAYDFIATAALEYDETGQVLPSVAIGMATAGGGIYGSARAVSLFRVDRIPHAGGRIVVGAVAVGIGAYVGGKTAGGAMRDALNEAGLRRRCNDC